MGVVVSEPPLSRQERRQLERAKAKAHLKQPYVDAITVAMADMPRDMVQPGSFNIAHVYHDDWCPALNGGFCRCQPEVAIEHVSP